MSATVDLSNVNLSVGGRSSPIGLDVDGGLDLGLEANVGLSLEPVRADLNANVGLGLDQIRADLNAGLDNVRLSASADVSGNVGIGLDRIAVRELPPIRLEARVSELPVVETRSQVDLGLDDIRIRELAPIRLEFGVRPFRLHLPLSYKFSLSLFGKSILKFSVCGEGMAVGEGYEPKEAERCR